MMNDDDDDDDDDDDGGDDDDDDGDGDCFGEMRCICRWVAGRCSLMEHQLVWDNPGYDDR